MKKLILFLVMMLAACSAPMPGEDVGEVQEAVCSSAPLISGSSGTSMAAPWLRVWDAQALTYTAWPNTSSNLQEGAISWGANSSANFRTTNCQYTVTGPCLPFPAGKTTTLSFTNNTVTVGTSMFINGVKVAELANVISLSPGGTFNGGLTRVRGDGGANSRMWLDGWHDGVKKSVGVIFSNPCGAIH